MDLNRRPLTSEVTTEPIEAATNLFYPNVLSHIRFSSLRCGNDLGKQNICDRLFHLSLFVCYKGGSRVFSQTRLAMN